MHHWHRGLPVLACVMLAAAGLPAIGAEAAGKAMPAGRQDGPRFNVHFKTELSKVLSALAVKSGASIVIPEEIKTLVTVDLTDVTIEEAIRQVTASAGVAYRRIGKTYIVAPVKTMPEAMALYGTTEQVALRFIGPTEAVKAVTDAVPFVTARPSGRKISVTGAPEDIELAKKLLSEIDVQAPVAEQVDSTSITMVYVPASDIQALLASQFPTIKAQKVGDSTVAFTGPHTDVQRASELIKSLDKGKDSTRRYVVYNIKYSSARALLNSLRQLNKSLTIVAGPEPYHIPYTRVNLSTANSISGGSSGLSGGGGSTGTGTGSPGGGDSGGGGGAGGAGGSGGSGESGGNAIIGERTRTLILGGTDDSLKAALDLLQKIDMPTPQVVLDVKVISTNPQTTESLGIDWSNNAQGAAASLSVNAVELPVQQNPTLPGQPALRDRFGIGNFARLPLQFSATLNAFFRRDDVRILAKPTITALDNEDGVVFVGETRRISVQSLGQGGGGANIVLNTIVEVPVGIILQMRPRVNADDMITLHVHPIYSSGGATDPRTGLFSTFQREADTTVRVRSGETIVIGGLLQDEDTKTLIKVPILGDIPLIGQFFRNHNRLHLRREVLVFVTPHLVKD